MGGKNFWLVRRPFPPSLVGSDLLGQNHAQPTTPLVVGNYLLSVGGQGGGSTLYVY
jgi:hypothetical protein